MGSGRAKMRRILEWRIWSRWREINTLVFCDRVSEDKRGPRGRPRAFVWGLSSPVLGLHSVGRLTSVRFCRVCLGTGDFLRPQGAIPQAFTPLGLHLLLGAWGAPKRGMPTGPTLKTALCHIRALVGRMINNQWGQKRPKEAHK